MLYSSWQCDSEIALRRKIGISVYQPAIHGLQDHPIQHQGWLLMIMTRAIGVCGTVASGGRNMNAFLDGVSWLGALPMSRAVGWNRGRRFHGGLQTPTNVPPVQFCSRVHRHRLGQEKVPDLVQLGFCVGLEKASNQVQVARANHILAAAAIVVIEEGLGGGKGPRAPRAGRFLVARVVFFRPRSSLFGSHLCSERFDVNAERLALFSTRFSVETRRLASRAWR